MGKECQRLIGWIEKGAVGLTAVFALAGWVVGGGAACAGVVAGGLVALLNFKGLQLFAGRVVLAADGQWARALTQVSAVARYLALTGVVVVLIKIQWFDFVAVLVGLSGVSLAVVVAGLLHGLQATGPEQVP